MALERLTHLQSVELVQAAHCSGHVTDFETLEAEAAASDAARDDQEAAKAGGTEGVWPVPVCVGVVTIAKVTCTCTTCTCTCEM